MKKIATILIMAAAVVLLSACGTENTANAEPENQTVRTADNEAPKVTEEDKSWSDETKTDIAAAREFTVPGTYTAFASESAGMCVSSDLLGIDAALTLNEDGTGTMFMKNESQTEINGDLTWTLDGEKLLFTAEGDSITGVLKDGIVTANFTGGVRLYFAKDGADTSAIKVMSAEEFLKALDELENGKKTEESSSAAEETADSARELAGKLNLYSDDTHYVLGLYGMLICYECDGDKITGCKAYMDALTDEGAKYAAESAGASDPKIESVESDGSVVVITYNESAYETLTVSDLDAVFKDMRIEK